MIVFGLASRMGLGAASRTPVAASLVATAASRWVTEESDAPAPWFDVIFPSSSSLQPKEKTETVTTLENISKARRQSMQTSNKVESMSKPALAHGEGVRAAVVPRRPSMRSHLRA
jgi:hypothetical protein